MKWIFPYLMTLVLMYGLASTVPSTLAQSQIDHQPTAPNIILIVADDLGYGELCQVEQSVGYDRSTKKKTSKSSGQFQWTPDRSVNRFRPGYPLLEGVAVFQGQFVACWSTHQSGEDGPGQYVRYARSNDGKAWQAPAELFPSIDKMQVSSGKGLGLTALRFVGVNQKLFAVAEAHQNTGFITADQLMTSER